MHMSKHTIRRDSTKKPVSAHHREIKFDYPLTCNPVSGYTKTKVFFRQKYSKIIT